MIRLGFSWKTAILATFFVSLFGLNLSLYQPSGDINTRKNSTNFQRIQYGTPPQTYSESQNQTGSKQNSSITTAQTKIFVRHVSPPQITPAPEPQPQQCSICPTSNDALKADCIKCPVQQNPCGTCSSFRQISSTESANVMCPMTMCAQ
jgi:hypothetical protein